MRTKIKKWGNCMAIRVPRLFVAEINIEYGSEVELTVKGDALIIRKSFNKLLLLLK